MIPDNLKRLYQGEQACRMLSISKLEELPIAMSQLQLTYDAMDVFDLARQQTSIQESDVLKAIALLSLRAFNACASTVMLGLSGYYTNAVGTLRDLLETAFLLEDFGANKALATDWLSFGFEDGGSKFKPSKVRGRIRRFESALYGEALAEQREKTRGDFYSLLSVYGSHVRRDGLALMTNDFGKVSCGPQFSVEPALALLADLTRLSGSCAFRVVHGFSLEGDDAFNASAKHFSQGWRAWCNLVTQKGPQRDDPLNKVLGITPV